MPSFDFLAILVKVNDCKLKNASSCVTTLGSLNDFYKKSLKISKKLEPVLRFLDKIRQLFLILSQKLVNFTPRPVFDVRKTLEQH